MFELMAALVLLIFMAIAWMQWSKRSLADALETERELGATGDATVGIAFDGNRHWVELVFDEGDIRVHVFVTSSETLLMAQWLRTAALPGRTLADVRDRRERAAA